jgi:hypothetical protein
MEKVRLLFCSLICSCVMFAQDSDFKTKGLLKATSTISPGFMLSETRTNIYLAGELEYFVEERVSLRGDGFWYLGSQQNPDLLRQNSSVYWGAAYHFRKNRTDLFIGVQPGLSLTQMVVDEKYYYTDYGMEVCPNFSFFTGVTQYVGKYFNFFLNTRYVRSSYRVYGSSNLDEIRLCAGLGFNIQTRK